MRGGLIDLARAGSASAEPAAALYRVLPVPTPKVTSCTFAGAGYRLLVVTTAAVDRPADDGAAGVTYACVPGDMVGVPVDRHAG
jgi:sugar lactone lactonase YvrE